MKFKGLCLSLFLIILASVFTALLPPLFLEQIINTLAAGKQLAFSAALGYFLIIALSGLFDAAKESMITVFGQHITHHIRSRMSAKLNRLPSAYFIENDPGATASRFVNDVNTVDNLFSSGIVSMAADVCKLLTILVVIYTKSLGLGILLTLITPLLFWLTRCFQKRMLSAQLENRAAVGKTNQQIPEALKNMRSIKVLHQEAYMLSRYGTAIDQSYFAQERSNFYDAIYSPIIVSVSALLIGIMMASAAQSGTIQTFFGMSAGAAAAVIAYANSFFEPLENIGMEIQNIQAAIAGVKRIQEFLNEPEPMEPSVSVSSQDTAVSLSGVSFRYNPEEPEVLHDFHLSVKEGDSITLSGRTGAGKSTIIKLIAGLYQPQSGDVRVFGMRPDSIPEQEKRHWFGYVEQQVHLIPGTIADQISMHDPQVSDIQIEQALRTVQLWNTISQFPNGMYTPCSEKLFSQGQLQLLSIARAIVLDPRILLLDEITSNLDQETEQMVLHALNEATQSRTSISVSHRINRTKNTLAVGNH